MSYPINAPITLVNTNANDEIDYQTDGPAAGLLNKALNFVVTTAGDLIYRDGGANNYLERLPIGTANQVLTVDSATLLPSWKTSANATSIFTARVVGSVAGIPTSRNGGADPGAWFTLSNTYVTWSTASPGLDPSAVFTVASGLFTAPATGTYSFDAVITFDSGAGVNAGTGLPAAPLPSGMSVRQAQIYCPTLGGGTQLATVTRQVEGSNNNCTAVSICVNSVALTAGDTVGIRVRHDRNAANTVTIGNVAISVPSQTYFTGRRLT